MSAKRIFVFNGHPAETSLSRFLATTYAQSARAGGHVVRITHLHDLDFDMDFGFSKFKDQKPLESGLLEFQKDLEWSQHFVVVTPMWWGGLPAKLKGLIDRSFLPGWAFDPRIVKHGFPEPLLTGRTARAIVTSDTPDLFFSLFYRKALFRQIKGQILNFIGMKPTRITHFAAAGKASPKAVTAWMTRVQKLAHKGI